MGPEPFYDQIYFTTQTQTDRTMEPQQAYGQIHYTHKHGEDGASISL